MASVYEHDDLLQEVRKAYCAHPKMVAFAAFPDKLRHQDTTPQLRASCDLMLSDQTLMSARYGALTGAIKRAAPVMRWRETYRGAGAGFMNRWGCFTVIGADSPFASDALRVFVVYMPAGLHYPSHRHPAEEIYLVLAGRAVFRRAGQPDAVLTEGQTMVHQSNEVHAIQTTDSPLLCLVAWRTHLETPPVLVADAPHMAAAPG